MELVPVQRGVRMVLHDPPFDLKMVMQRQFSPTADLRPGLPGSNDGLQSRLIFTPMQSGVLLKNLPVVHEHPMHVTVVSADLSYFDQVHPIPRPDGTLQIDYHFPRPGHYVIFADYFPTGLRDQAFRFPVTVAIADTSEDPPIQLATSSASVRQIDGHASMTAELVTQPRTLNGGIHAMLLF
jgi:hypothetical protein